jgi:hypothetical protein
MESNRARIVTLATYAQQASTWLAAYITFFYLVYNMLEIKG